VTLDLYADPIEVTKALVDIPSPSHHEEAIADAVEEALRGLDVEVARFGNTVCARTNRGMDSRVVLAGHIDTVPLADNVPHRMDTAEDGAEIMFGCGTVDMKSGMAVYLNAFAHLHESEELQHDLTVIAYEPVWAIGTGKVASADDAQEVCAAIRELVKELAGDEVAEGIRILYGGSVKVDSVAEIVSKPDVDGGLIGGASLVGEEFAKLAANAANALN